MNKYIKRRKRRHAVLLNTAAYILSYLTAILIRFGTAIEAWQIQLYSSIFISALLIAAALHFYRISTKKYKYVEEMDPMETLSYVVRNQLLLFFALLLYLFATQQAERVSRLVIVLFPLLNTFYEYTFRILYRRRILRREAHLPVDRKVDIITYSRYARIVENTLRSSLPSSIAVQDVFLWDGDRSWMDGLEPGDQLKEIYLFLPEWDRLKEQELIYQLEGRGFSVQLILSCEGNILTSDMMGGDSAFLTVHFDNLATKCSVLGINYTVSSPDKAAAYVKTHLKDLGGKYICFSNVHTTVTAHENPDYLAVQNHSAFTFPDGAPIAKYQIRKGYNDAKRVAGPDFMGAMFRFTQNTSIRHFFYGSTEETLRLLEKNLREKYPGLQIAGTYSPPFHEISEEEDEKIVRMLNDSHADIYWIGLGAPKQENWMAEHEGRIPGVMIGVGAGFNFYAGNIKRAPYWMQKAGLEWLYRLTQDPKRLFKRYFATNIKFGWYVLTERGERKKKGSRNVRSEGK